MGADLLLFFLACSERAALSDQIWIRANGIAGTSYDAVGHSFLGDGTDAPIAGEGAGVSGWPWTIRAATAVANRWSNAVGFILGWQSTTRHKNLEVISTTSFGNANANERYALTGGGLRATAALTSLRLETDGVANLTAGSTIRAYAINGTGFPQP